MIVDDGPDLSANAGHTYVVQSGDTLSSIASRKYGKLPILGRDPAREPVDQSEQSQGGRKRSSCRKSPPRRRFSTAETASEVEVPAEFFGPCDSNRAAHLGSAPHHP